ncbi:MAG TPA: hypothetical protein PKI66_00200 [Methanobacteriaceae archaeon]|jgi:hypothetical protein|nr:hypothetical protein [Methanobacteriaceae archaeon]
MGIRETVIKREEGVILAFIPGGGNEGGILASHATDEATGMNAFYNFSQDRPEAETAESFKAEIISSPEVIMDTHQPEIEEKLRRLGILTEAEAGRWTVEHENFVRLWKMYHSGSGEISPQEYAFTLFYSQNEDPEKRKRVDKIVIRHTPRLLVYYVYRKEDEVEVEDQPRKRGRSPGRPKKKRPEGEFNMGMHTVKQFYNNLSILTLFSEAGSFDKKIDDYINNTGIRIKDKKPGLPGLNITEALVLQGILTEFSNTKYMGTRQVTKEAEFKERGIIKNNDSVKIMETTYRNINQIPVLELTQADVIRLSGYESTMGEKQDVIKALESLGETQYVFFWKRLAKDEKGIPLMDKNGDYKKELVMEVGTYFRIKHIFQDNTNILKHYEISPSAVILDQVNDTYGGTYYLTIPKKWDEEIKKLTGRRATPYTYFFLLWLRMKFEEIRQFNNLSRNKAKKKPFILKYRWEDIAIILNMPESMYKLNRKRAREIIEKAYTIATRLGYLLRVENDVAVDVLYLNEEFFPQGRELFGQQKTGEISRP